MQIGGVARREVAPPPRYATPFSKEQEGSVKEVASTANTAGRTFDGLMPSNVPQAIVHHEFPYEMKAMRCTPSCIIFSAIR